MNYNIIAININSNINLLNAFLLKFLLYIFYFKNNCISWKVITNYAYISKFFKCLSFLSNNRASDKPHWL